MFKKNKSEDWMEKLWHRVERDWDRWENAIQIIFVMAGIIFPISLGYALSGEGNMNPIVGVMVSISFWVLILTSVLLVRNSGKINRQKLDEIEQNTKATNSKLDNLTNSINELVKRIDERWPK